MEVSEDNGANHCVRRLRSGGAHRTWPCSRRLHVAWWTLKCSAAWICDHPNARRRCFTSFPERRGREARWYLGRRRFMTF